MPGDKAPQVSVKTDSYKRLPSFRTPRDLKLSEFREIVPNPLGEGRTKRVFVPNLNVTRKKPDEKDGKPESSCEGSKPQRGAGDTRGRGRGRRSGNFVQATGIFSEGLAPTIKSSGWRSKSSAEPSTSVPKQKIKPNAHIKVDKDEEEMVMKELMRDDFLDDPELEPDSEYCPVELPLLDCKLEDHVKKTEKLEPLQNGVKVKEEPVENGVEEKPVRLDDIRPYSIPQLISRSSDKNFMFLQIPTSVPGLKLEGQRKKGSKNEDEVEKYVLRTLPPGKIGTLQIRKSGKSTLLLGDVKLSVDPGTQAAFRQDLVSVNLDGDTKTGNMINLGRVTTRMIIAPEWESLLNN